MKVSSIIIIIAGVVLVALVGLGSASPLLDRFMQMATSGKHIDKRTNNYVQCWSQYGGRGRCCGTVDTRGVAIGNIDNHCTVQLGSCCYGGADGRCHWQYGAVCP